MITVDVVRELLGSQVDDPTLIIVGGQAHVVSGAAVGEDRYAGGLVVVSRDELHHLATNDADEMSEWRLRELAAQLEATVAHLGG